MHPVQIEGNTKIIDVTLQSETYELPLFIHRVLKIRREKSKPLIEALKIWADETSPALPQQTLSGVAVRYMLERWEKLILFLGDAILRLDTNPVEGLIRPFAVGRKNWLFAETASGAEASAALYSLIVMAGSAGLNPFLYLKAVFTDLPKAIAAEDVEKLLPWIWKPLPEVPVPTVP